MRMPDVTASYMDFHGPSQGIHRAFTAHSPGIHQATTRDPARPLQRLCRTTPARRSADSRGREPPVNVRAEIDRRFQSDREPQHALANAKLGASLWLQALVR